MSDTIKMNYPLMEAMAYAFDSAGENLESMISEVNAIVQLIADGALVGVGGDALEESCRISLIPALQRLQEKSYELEKDIIAAMEAMKREDKNITGFMG